ncbi:hypothetical protein [Luteimonas mephitis]|uniref:hypothetical protein n=1 Tax=Luteimonas mephitis TaxID=83615 RepID=UPI00041BAB30|nr:hypothetical protein [Luteimonas mephitis]
MDKRFWVCGLVMSIAALLLGFIVHGLLLAPDYAALGAMFRSDDDSRHYVHWMVLAHVLIGFAMTWIYVQGFSSGRSSSMQGLRFGLAMALFSTVPGYLIYYAVQPLPAALVIKQLLLGMATMLLLGLLVAWLQPRRKVLAELP